MKAEMSNKQKVNLRIIIVIIFALSILGYGYMNYKYKVERDKKEVNDVVKKDDLSEMVYVLDTTSSPYYSIIMCEKQRVLDIYKAQLKWGYEKTQDKIDQYRTELYDLYIEHCDSGSGQYYNPESSEFKSK